MMTGKDLKAIVSMIPDDAVVDFGVNENHSCTHYDPAIIIGATTQTNVSFSDSRVETTIIFDIIN